MNSIECSRIRVSIQEGCSAGPGPTSPCTFILHSNDPSQPKLARHKW